MSSTQYEPLARLDAARSELHAANGRVHDLERLREQFVATVGHELNTPLTSIRAFAEILLNEPDLDEEQRRDFLQIVVNESERLTRVTNDVLDLARIDRKTRTEWHMRRTNMLRLLENAVQSVAPLYRQRDVKLVKELPEHPVLITIDRERILQVVVSLLSNATQFCERGKGQVKLSMSCTQNLMTLSVADDGVAVGSHDHSVNHKRFPQPGNGQPANHENTSLTFAHCKYIVEHHWGRIWIDSEPGERRLFFFALPIN